MSDPRARMDALAKPPGSLGRLEDLAVWLAEVQGRTPPTVERPRVLVFAADHGVARAWPVSPYPPEVTEAMVATFASGRAAVGALARNAGAELRVVDVGVAGAGPSYPTAPGIELDRTRRLAAGTADLVEGPAMSPALCAAAVALGAEEAERAARDGVDLLVLGEMGIGNTTAAAALAAALLGRPATDLVGPGTGLNAEGVSRKASLVQRALDRGGPREPLAALADLGGLEIAALTGALGRARALRLPVLLDGFIVGAAALAAARAWPGCERAFAPASRSAEPGHARVLEALGLAPPLLDLGLRLGEASAATLAIPLARAAARVMAEMATLEEVLAASR